MEDYSSAHAEKVEELLHWPWKRFEALYTAFLRRKAVEQLQARKLAMTAGFWANDGMNDDKGTRREALDDLEQHFDEAISLIYAGTTELQERASSDQFTEEDEKNPFLAPAIKATRGIEAPRDDEGTVQQAIEADGTKELDQT